MACRYCSSACQRTEYGRRCKRCDGRQRSLAHAAGEFKCAATTAHAMPNCVRLMLRALAGRPTKQQRAPVNSSTHGVAASTHADQLAHAPLSGASHPVRAPGGDPPPFNPKSKLCRYFSVYGNCQRGSECVYAHGAAELEPDPYAPSSSDNHWRGGYGERPGTGRSGQGVGIDDARHKTRISSGRMLMERDGFDHYARRGESNPPYNSLPQKVRSRGDFSLPGCAAGTENERT